MNRLFLLFVFLVSFSCCPLAAQMSAEQLVIPDTTRVKPQQVKQSLRSGPTYKNRPARSTPVSRSSTNRRRLSGGPRYKNRSAKTHRRKAKFN